MQRRSFLSLPALPLVAQTARTPKPGPLVVISVDGLDHRYLRDRDNLALQIPNLRRLLRGGLWADDGVVGVFPSLTWPAHTSLITGKLPGEHGITGNRRGPGDTGEYFWDASLLKSRTLWQAAREAGLTTAAIGWPVTVGADIDYNLPEIFQATNEGAPDLVSVESKATEGLIGKIAARFPSFPQTWFDDRTRTLAALFILHEFRPDLLLLRFVGLDAESHEKGPFTREANAILEHTDEHIGRIVRSLPRSAIVAVVSDHGFERTDKIMNAQVLLNRQQISGTVRSFGGVAATDDEEAAGFLRRASNHPDYTVGREIPAQEWQRLAPHLPQFRAVFEAATHFWFGSAREGELFEAPTQRGSHGFWPTREDYRSSFILWQAYSKPERIASLAMTQIAERLAAALSLPWGNG
jgi:hypothetical protein